MAIKKADEESAKRNYEVKVTSVREIKPGRYGFNAEVNGLAVNNFMFVEYVNKEGKEGTLVAMPQMKSKDDKYYNAVWFPVSKELKDDIEKQISDILNS